MAVSAIAPTTNAAAPDVTPTAPTGADTEKRFLRLLVTQLKNQDPLNPLDNAQLTSQLAQMSPVTGIEKLNTAFQSLITQSGSGQVLQSAALIGRSVLVAGNDLVVKQGADAQFAVDMAGPAEKVTATIKDATGKIIKSFDLGALPEGLKSLSWDGKTDSGVQVADGSYSLSIVASAGDKPVTANAMSYANVVSVAQSPNGVSLDLGGNRKANLSDVRQIL